MSKPVYKIFNYCFNDDAGWHSVYYVKRFVFGIWWPLGMPVCYSKEGATAEYERLIGIRKCMKCHTVMIEDKFGLFCPDEECDFIDKPIPRHI